MLDVLSWMSQAETARNERIRFRKCRLYIVNMSYEEPGTRDLFCRREHCVCGCSWARKLRDFVVQ